MIAAVAQLLPRFLQTYEERVAHARALAKVVQEAGGDANVEQERKRHAPSAVDALAARGVPLVGPGCAGGVIRGTDPLGALIAKQPR